MEIPTPSDADKDDLWTFFGSFSEAEISGAALALKESGVRFEVKKDEKNDAPGGWSGPFALWVLDDEAARASGILVPYFHAPRGEMEGARPAETTVQCPPTTRSQPPSAPGLKR